MPDIPSNTAAEQLSSQQWQNLSIEAGRVFSPTAPIDERSLFAGREKQVLQVLDAINQKGQHAILFGERGVGKTSLANVLSSFLVGHPSGAVLAPRVNCASGDSFADVWEKVFNRIQLTQTTPTAGFQSAPSTAQYSATATIEKPITADGVYRALVRLSQGALPIIIVDEFDRLGQAARRAFADTIKALSDGAVGATILLVGVADSVDGLIEEHQSVERALVQVRMPRMSPGEIEKIIVTGLTHLNMAIAPEMLKRISLLSQGLPHYAHLIGLHAARVAVDRRTMFVTEEIVDEAIQRALDAAQQSVRSAYHDAIRSARKDNLFADVLLACALADTNELGFFAAQDVREPIRAITGKPYDIPTFAQHLNEFADAKRGPVLQKTGTERRYRYRFINPLMQPFVIMKGFANGRIDRQTLDELRQTAG